MSFIWEGFAAVTWQQLVMYLVGAALIYVAIKKEYEPALLLPMGFGAILVNLPGSNALNQTLEGVGEVNGIIQWLYDVGIEASEALPILLCSGTEQEQDGLGQQRTKVNHCTDTDEQQDGECL